MAILVTGGAGYIGSVVTEELIKDKYQVIVIDNLKHGHREAISQGTNFIRADIKDKFYLNELFTRHKIEAVMHMAAETEVETSMIDPQVHYQANVASGLALLEVMLQHDIKKIVFSSSAAVYGEPQTSTIEENHPKNPINAYGETKLTFERILEWYRRAYGIQYIALRYFNAAGASQLHGEDHHPETHLIPRVIRAALTDSPVKVMGTDYLTRDGSCIRDYVHVTDIARAHILALEKLETLNGKAFNLGSGDGYSVLDVIETVKKVTKNTLNIQFSARRPGDPAVLVASSKLARKELGWQPRYNSLDDVIESCWSWAKQHPQGYATVKAGTI